MCYHVTFSFHPFTLYVVLFNHSPDDGASKDFSSIRIQCYVSESSHNQRFVTPGSLFRFPPFRMLSKPTTPPQLQPPSGVNTHNQHYIHIDRPPLNFNVSILPPGFTSSHPCGIADPPTTCSGNRPPVPPRHPVSSSYNSSPVIPPDGGELPAPPQQGGSKEGRVSKLARKVQEKVLLSLGFCTSQARRTSPRWVGLTGYA